MQVEFLGGYGVDMRLTFDLQQNRNENTSTLRVTKLEIKSQDGLRYGARYVTGTITLNGHPAVNCTIGATGGCALNVSGEYSGGGDGIWNDAYWHSATLTVPHWATGECSISMHSDVSVGSMLGEHLGAIKEDKTADLPPIAPVTAAKIRASAAELGKPVTLNLEGTDDRATYTITWSCGSQSGTVAKDQTKAQYTTTLPETLKEYSTDGGKTVSVTFRAVTKQYGQTIGQTTAAIKATVPVKEMGELIAAAATTGEEMSIRIAGADERIKYTVQIIVGNETVTVAEETAERAWRYTPPDELAAQFPRAARILATVKATASEGGKIEKDIWLWAGSGANPEVGTMTLEDVSSIHAGVGQLIQGKSKLHVSLPVTAKYGATITSATVRVEYYSGNVLEAKGTEATFIMNTDGGCTIVVNVTDSRGRSVVAAERNRVVVRKYNNPTARVSRAYRCNSNGAANDQGDYARIIFSADAVSTTQLPFDPQSIRYKAEVKAYGAASGTKTNVTAYDGVLSVENGSAIVRLGQSGSYTARILAEDVYGSGQSAWATIQAKFALMDFDRDSKSVGIGQKAGEDGKLRLGMTVNMDGSKIEGVATPTESGDAANKSYVDSGGVTENVAIAPVGTGQAYGLFGVGYALNATQFLVQVPLSVPMKKKPTRVSVTGNLRIVLGKVGSQEVHTVNTVEVRDLFSTFVVLAVSTRSQMTTGCIGIMTSNNDASARIDLYAE